MKLESVRVHQQIRHPHYGTGEVKAIGEHTIQVQFPDGLRTLDPGASGVEPVESASVAPPLRQVIEETATAVLEAFGFGKPDAVVEQLGRRWHGGKLLLKPYDPTLQPKEVPLEVFFHKIVMLRNNLRVLEQKINADPNLSDADKVEWQQYITRCYGSLTTFNLLFQNKEDGFRGGGAGA